MKKLPFIAGLFSVFFASFFLASLLFEKNIPDCYAEELCTRVQLRESDVQKSESIQKNNQEAEETLKEVFAPIQEQKAEEVLPQSPLSVKEQSPVVLSSYPRLSLPFTSQAPFENWNPPFDEACEEASLIMVKSFLFQEELTRDTADAAIKNLTDWEKEQGYEIDIGIEDVKKVAEGFYKLNGDVYSGTDVSIEKIKELIDLGHPVIIPAAGKKLQNPHFTGDGPPYHMLVVVGYDATHFIAHDPGTKHGAFYPYDQQLLFDAIHDWTGSKNTIEQGEKMMLTLFP